MKPSDSIDSITYSGLKDLVERYDFHVKKELQTLEEKRLKEIPEAIRKRKKDGTAFLEVDISPTDFSFRASGVLRQFERFGSLMDITNSVNICRRPR